VKAILVTGMSATGKSGALELLAARGHLTVDTDTDEWSEWQTLPDKTSDWVWRESAITALSARPRTRTLYVAGCKSNQGMFYPRFDEIVLLSASVDVMLERSGSRRGRRTRSARIRSNAHASSTTWRPWSRYCGARRPPRSTRRFPCSTSC